MSLRSLPHEILSQIASYAGTSRSSLCDLSLISRQLNSVTALHRFKTVKIQLTHVGQLRQFSRCPDTILQNTRHLILEGWLADKHDPALAARWEAAKTRYPGPILDSFMDHKSDSWMGLQHLGDRNAEYEWSYLINMVQRMHYLTDLTWAIGVDFPGELLQAIEEFHPQCKIHMDAFYLPSLVNPSSEMDPCELEIATSRNVHSIVAGYHPRLMGGSLEDYNYEGIKQIASGLAPGLKELTLFWEGDNQYSEAHEPYRKPLEAIQPSLADQLGRMDECIPKKHSLQKLKLYGKHEIGFWNSKLDFPSLRVLELGPFLQLDTFTSLTNCQFSLLQTLVLEHSPPFPISVADESTLDFHMSRFLLSLPRLSALKLTGTIGPASLSAVTHHHGPTLTRLHLLPLQETHRYTLDACSLRALTKHCVDIEELTISLRRSRGDYREVSAYRCLGRLSKLRELYLLLDCSQFELGRADVAAKYCDERYISASDRKLVAGLVLPNGHRVRAGTIKESFVNCAVDGELAQAIFNIVQKAKGPGASKLERISVQAIQAFTFHAEEVPAMKVFQDMAKYVKRRWTVERCERDDSRDQVVVSSSRAELTSQDCLKINGMEVDWDVYVANVPLVHEAGELFKQVWPEIVKTSKRGGQQQSSKLEWSSFPLAGV